MKDVFLAESQMRAVRCNLCNADSFTVLYHSNLGDSPATIDDYTSTTNRYGFYHRIVSCNQCGLIYMNPRDVSTAGLYGQVVDEAYVNSWKERGQTFRRHLSAMRAYRPACLMPRLLDIGCYAGIFLAEAKRDGYDVTGIEPSQWAVQVARSKTGAEVFRGSWDEARLPAGSFHVVTMWDVIEHLEDPAACLKQANKWLGNNGIIALTTHDIAGWFPRLMKGRYPWLMRFHLYHFNPGTLSALLVKYGFEPLKTVYYAKTFSLRYFLNRLGIPSLRGFLDRIHVSVNTGDMFMIIARKKTTDERKA